MEGHRSDPALQQHKSLSSEAYTLISQALELEATRPQQAFVDYTKGIAAIEHALRLTFRSAADRAKTDTLNAKLRTNLAFVQERVRALAARGVGGPASARSSAHVQAHVFLFQKIPLVLISQ